MSKPIQRVKLRKVGNSIGITLPKEALAQLRMTEGDEVSVQVIDGRLIVSNESPEFERELQALEESIHEFRDTYRELAK